jgi:oligoribonuclease NrnB/cAMP/cGMP phosphodiesterase (DHH superfamily)
MIDSLHKQGYGFQLIDHHGTATWLAEKYPMWCEVRTQESNLGLTDDGREKVLSSGTSLFYKFLRNKNLPKMEQNMSLKSFAENVRRYDCWEWHNVYKDDHPKRLNDLMYLIGREKFIERFSSNPNPTFTDLELTLLEIEQHRINKYIWYKMRDVKMASIVVDEIMYNVAYVFAEQNVSLLGNEIAEKYGSKVDFVAIIDAGSNKVSLRGIHEHIDLGKDIARYFGGGGHMKASGFEFDASLSNGLFKKVFKQ